MQNSLFFCKFARAGKIFILGTKEKNMKKIYIAIIGVVCFGFLAFGEESHAIYKPGWTYWDNWKSTFTKLIPKQEETQTTSQQRISNKTKFEYPYRYRYTTETRERQLQTRRPWSYSGVTREQKSAFNTQQTQRVTQAKTDLYERLRKRFQQKQDQYQAVAHIRAHTQKPIQDIEGTVHDVLTINITNKVSKARTTIPTVLLVDEMKVQLFSGSGIAEDPENFELVVNENQSYNFEKDGTVSLQFKNARIAQNESIGLDLGVQIKNPDFVPNTNGSFRLRVQSVTLRNEETQEKVKTLISGTPISEYVVYNIIPKAGNDAVINVRKQSISGRLLSAGESAYVFSMRFEAYADDMEIQEIILHDTLSLGAIDSFSERITAKAEGTYAILGSGRFVNGQARIRFKDPIKIYRNGRQKTVLFEIEIAERVKTDKNQFKLEVDPRDIAVYSTSTGRDVPNSRKNIRSESDIFKVVQSGGGLYVDTDGEQPDGFFVSKAVHSPVFRFRVVNNDKREISIARVSLDVLLSGVDFADGKSIDDFQLKRLYRGREVDAGFVPTLASGNTVQFDTPKEIFIPGESSLDLVLKLKMEDIVSGRSKYDTVLVNVLGDKTLEKGTVNALRSGNTHFIWSDHSGAPHTETSDDWMSGYLIDGLPSGSIPLYRD